MDALTELSYALDTFYFLVTGVLVMWMAAGFSMLEAGLVRAKNTAEILTKNISLFAVACIMYMLMGYGIMYPADAVNAWWPGLGGILGSTDNTVEEVLASGGDTYYSGLSDFFFQVVFVATAMSIVSGAVAERMKLWAFLFFAVVMTGFIYPMQGYWKWGGGALDALGFLDFAGSGVVHLCGATAAFAGVLLLGARKGKYRPDGTISPIPGANMPLATLGTFILWIFSSHFSRAPRILFITRSWSLYFAYERRHSRAYLDSDSPRASIIAPLIIWLFSFSMLHARVK